MDESSGDGVAFPETNVTAVRALAGAVVTTLGPTPSDKLVVDSESDDTTPGHGKNGTAEYVVTSDGSTILDTLSIDHPIAPLVRRIAGPKRPGESDVEGQDIPDGVTTTLVLTAALLDEAADLVDRGIHPAVIRRGYEVGLDVATRTLADLALPADGHLHDVARTAMTGNDIGGLGDEWAGIAVEAVETVGAPKPDTFAVRTRRRGAIDDTRLVHGTVLDRNEISDERMPRRATDATVLVLAGQEEGGLRTLDRYRDYTADVRSPETLQAVSDTDADRRCRIIQTILDLGVEVVVAKQGVEREYARLLAEHDVISIDGVTRLYLGQICNATGATPLKRTEDMREAILGQAGVVEEIRGDPKGPDRPDRRLVVIDGCPDAEATCVLLSGIWGSLGETATRELRKAAAAVAAARGHGDHRQGIVPGGGAAEVVVAAEARAEASTIDRRAQLAVDGFADAVDTLVFSLLKNAGLDPLAVSSELRAATTRSTPAHGVRLPGGDIVDVTEAGILDPLSTRRNCYVTAVELASLLIGIDDAIPASFSEPEPDPDDAIYEDAAEQQRAHRSTHEHTRWDD